MTNCSSGLLGKRECLEKVRVAVIIKVKAELSKTGLGISGFPFLFWCNIHGLLEDLILKRIYRLVVDHILKAIDRSCGV